jgi:enamine deaminase RidA (YjgF/YER057c/UK114 family)
VVPRHAPPRQGHPAARRPLEAELSVARISFEQRLRELGVDLPPAPAPPGHYAAAYVHGDAARTAGHLPFEGDAIVSTGRLGAELDAAAGAAAARVAALNALASLRAAIGSLDRVHRVVELRGYVSSTPEFAEHHLVTNGASDLILSIFGPDAGAHVRASVGVASLPFRAPVEIELGVLLEAAA